MDGADYDKFGYSIAVQNGIALIGAPHHDVATPNDQAGAVYIYDLNTGLEIGRLLPPTMDFNGHFGIGVDIDGNLAAVGGSPASLWEWTKPALASEADLSAHTVFVVPEDGLNLSEISRIPPAASQLAAVYEIAHVA